VIERERRGDYLGKTVQVIPHVTDAIQEWIERVAHIPVDGTKKTPDICLIELGGTVGDIESMVFLEALRQFQYRVGRDNFCHISVSLVPVVGGSSEQKSKPTQHCVRELRAAGLPPDMLFCRSSLALERSVIRKISSFCMVPSTHVISIYDVSNIMRVPLVLSEQRVPSHILNHLRINTMPPDDLPEWRKMADVIDQSTNVVKIALVGKYTGMGDAYLSVTKSLFYAANACARKLEIVWIESEHLEDRTRVKKPESFIEAWTSLKSSHGVLVPGGFGDRGVEGMILAVHYARMQKVPFLGICLGMQVAVIEYARAVLKLEGANSAEFDAQATDLLIISMPEVDANKMVSKSQSK
jgi:CTP synthase